MIAVLIFTFILTILDKFFLDKKIEQVDLKVRRNLFYRLIKSKYVLLILIFGLLIFQIKEAIQTSSENKKRDTTTTDTHVKVSKTYDKVQETNLSINDLLDNINSSLEITKKELSLISNVNDDIKNVRDGIDKNILEFNSIKSQYEKQIRIEREKINEARPIIKVIWAESVIDSSGYSYQIVLKNFGERIADSIIFSSIMVFVNNNDLLIVDLFKSNDDETNILSIPGKESSSNVFILNSVKGIRPDLKSFNYSFLLIKYKYSDIMTSKQDSVFNVYAWYTYKNQRSKYDVKESNMESIKKGLYEKYRYYYKIFYGK